MSRELTDNEYVAMLVDGNASMFWHWLPTKCKPGDTDEHIKDAIYRGVKQALVDRAGFTLPGSREALMKLAEADGKRLDTPSSASSTQHSATDG